jgi:mannose-6-phosphate isomerase-like protein (cupin superfamily)
VTKGIAKLTMNRKSSLLNAGQSLMLKENQTLVLENAGDDPLIAIGVKTNSIPSNLSTVTI